jgi:hypothetical protein
MRTGEFKALGGCLAKLLSSLGSTFGVLSLAAATLRAAFLATGLLMGVATTFSGDFAFLLAWGLDLEVAT